MDTNVLYSLLQTNLATYSGFTANANKRSLLLVIKPRVRLLDLCMSTLAI